MYFKSRPYTRGDALAKELGLECKYFKSRPYTRGDIDMQRSKFVREIFQVTPLHEGRRGGVVMQFVTDRFQVTPLHEGRRWVHSVFPLLLNFKSRPYTRGDRQSAVFFHDLQISSHAPTRGATGEWQQRFCRSFRFQVTPLHEGRRCLSTAFQA